MIKLGIFLIFLGDRKKNICSPVVCWVEIINLYPVVRAGINVGLVNYGLLINLGLRQNCKKIKV